VKLSKYYFKRTPSTSATTTPRASSKPADIRKFVKEHAGKAVKTTSAEL
jgi:hypothetical protein